jgi:hypothetical protein
VTRTTRICPDSPSRFISYGLASSRLLPSACEPKTNFGLITLHRDNRSPLIDLLNCVVCKDTMKIEKSDPDAEASGDMVQYRCERCGRI